MAFIWLVYRLPSCITTRNERLPSRDGGPCGNGSARKAIHPGRNVHLFLLYLISENLERGSFMHRHPGRAGELHSDTCWKISQRTIRSSIVFLLNA